MSDYAEERWGDPDDFILSQIKQYGGISGYDVSGNQWTLSTWYGEDKRDGCNLIEIKGAKLWYELRLKADLPPLPVMPMYTPQVPADVPIPRSEFPQNGDEGFYVWNLDDEPHEDES